MWITELRGEEALDAVLELVDPVGELLKDGKVAQLLQRKELKDVVKALLANYRDQTIEILAICNRTTAKEYLESMNPFTPLKDGFRLLTDPIIMELFLSQGQELASSGSATESTEEGEA